VDDEDGFRRSLVFKLKGLYGADVEEATSGGMALKRLESLTEDSDFDLILMDISMPGPSGIEVYKELRKRGVNTLVVFMSAYFTADNQEEANALGVTLLNKPIDNVLLKSIILTCGGTQTS
jgi:CheY-like chemotaxis protein